MLCDPSGMEKRPTIPAVTARIDVVVAQLEHYDLVSTADCASLLNRELEAVLAVGANEKLERVPAETYRGMIHSRTCVNFWFRAREA